MKQLAPLIVLMIALFALAACETIPVSATAPSATPSMTGALELGTGWRTQTAAQTLDAFTRTIAARYGQGTPTPSAIADLQHAAFTCAENHDTGARGAPPNEICRKTQVANGCTHTWQVHLFGETALTRARALYDRRCGSEALLGGPS